MALIKYPDHSFKFIKKVVKSDEGKQVIEDVGLIPAE